MGNPPHVASTVLAARYTIINQSINIFNVQVYHLAVKATSDQIPAVTPTSLTHIYHYYFCMLHHHMVFQQPRFFTYTAGAMVLTTLQCFPEMTQLQQ